MSSSQNPYINQGQGNQNFPFPAQQQNNPPKQNNARVNLVQPSLTSQQHMEEQMNLDNPSNVANKRPKSKPKGEPDHGITTTSTPMGTRKGQPQPESKPRNDQQ